MKTLYLLRHAKSGWDAPVATDFERPLNRRGHKAARAMGHAMRGIGFDHILASPAVRVAETLDGLAEAWGHAIAAEEDRRLYLAAPSTLLDFVRQTDDRHSSLLIVGHNPGLEQLTLYLTRDGAMRDRAAEKFPTAALAEIELPVAHWRDVGEGEGELVRFLRPRDLDPELGPED